jgi:type VI secretion system protein ImpB
MASESQQHKLDRVRPPRVQITYDVDENGAVKDKHLPFVVGIMADLSGDNERNLPSLRDPNRKFVNIDRDNIDDVMADAAPALSYTVDNTLTGEGLLRVNLAFSKLDDLSPAAVAAQVPALKELLDMRKKLDEALAKLSTNTQLEDLLNEVLANQEKVHQLAREMGLTNDEDSAQAADAPPSN